MKQHYLLLPQREISIKTKGTIYDVSLPGIISSHEDANKINAKENLIRMHGIEIQILR